MLNGVFYNCGGDGGGPLVVLVGRVNLTLEGKHVKWVFYDRGGSGGDGEEMV